MDSLEGYLIDDSTTLVPCFSLFFVVLKNYIRGCVRNLKHCVGVLAPAKKKEMRMSYMLDEEGDTERDTSR